MAYTLEKISTKPYAQALVDTREALANHGFGILWEIDVKKTMEKKIQKGEDYGQYIILGACNPNIAHQALQSEYPLGALLPCNVTVYETPGEATVTIGAVDPEVMLGITGNPELSTPAKKVRELLKIILTEAAS